MLHPAYYFALFHAPPSLPFEYIPSDQYSRGIQRLRHVVKKRNKKKTSKQQGRR